MHINRIVIPALLTLGMWGGEAAQAAPIASPIVSGTLGMAFVYQAEDATGANVPLGSATAIDFGKIGNVFDAGAPSTANSGIFGVTQATGSFALAGISAFQQGVIQDLVFAPFSAITPFFTVGTVSFALTGITVTEQSNAFLGLQGTGIFTNGDSAQTIGTWGFSGQTAANGALTGTFSWSADASPVPEPASMLLPSSSMLGMMAVRRRSNAA
jgi:hypothetical protein